MSKDNRAIAAKSGKWAAFVAWLKMLAEYTGDCLTGNKHKCARLNQEKQKIK